MNAPPSCDLSQEMSDSPGEYMTSSQVWDTGQRPVSTAMFNREWASIQWENRDMEMRCVECGCLVGAIPMCRWARSITVCIRRLALCSVPFDQLSR